MTKRRLAMTMTEHIEVLPDFTDVEFDVSLPLSVGAGAVDPILVEPHSELMLPATEDIVASCCSYL